MLSCDSVVLISLEEVSDLIEKSAQAGIVFQHKMIAPFERHKACAGNAGREPAPLLEGLHCIVATVEHEGGSANTRQEIYDVDVLGHHLLMRMAFSAEVVFFCRSLNQRICSDVPPGRKRVVKIWRKAGFSCPQP